MGKEIWPDGAVFEGQFVEGKKNGPGVFQWCDGSIFKGNFMDNNINGRGEYSWPDK